MLIRATQSQVNLQSARYRQPSWPQSGWPAGEREKLAEPGCCSPYPHPATSLHSSLSLSWARPDLLPPERLWVP